MRRTVLLADAQSQGGLLVCAEFFFKTRGCRVGSALGAHVDAAARLASQAAGCGEAGPQASMTGTTTPKLGRPSRMSSLEAAVMPRNCPACGTELSSRLLACPSCSRLVHADELNRLAETAAAAQLGHDAAAAIAAWRSAQLLLPPESRQHAEVGHRIEALLKITPSAAKKPGSSSAMRKGLLATMGAVLLGVLLKLKTIIGLGAGLGKFLLLGLSKAGTFFSMLATIAVYWAIFGWQIAVLIVVSLYLHEMGHVAELKRRGYPATAPMFIPGLGAFVRLQLPPASPAEDARIGLAGPLWGLGAAFVAWLAHLAFDAPVLAATAHLGAWINLLNLTPVWQLDGARAFSALSRMQRGLAAASLLAAYAVTHEGLLLVIGLVAAFRTALGRQSETADHGALALYIALVALLSALLLVPVPLP